MIEGSEPVFARLVRVIAYCLAIMIASRLALELIGMGARILVDPVTLPDFRKPEFAPNLSLDIWGAWDTGWFLDIIENGYDKAVRTAPGIENQANWAFYPLYPFLSKAVAGLTGMAPFTTMLVISNLAFAAALPIVWYETRHFYGDRAADLAVVLFAFIPGSYIFSSAYSESLFLLFVMMSLVLARRHNWLLAGLAAALATLTRNLGILLVIPIMMHAIQAVVMPGRQSSRQIQSSALTTGTRTALAVLLPVAALAAFMLFLWRHTDDPLAFASVQGAWKRELQNPLVTLLGPIMLAGKIQAELVPSVIMSWISVAVTVMLVMRRNWPHAAFMIAVVTITLASGILSYFRLFLTMAPGVMIAASFLADRPRLAPAMIGLLAAANGFMMAAWALGLGIY